MKGNVSMDLMEERIKNLEDAVATLTDTISSLMRTQVMLIADIEEIRKENKNDSSTDIKKT